MTENNIDIRYRELDHEALDIVEPLWEKLRSHHAERAEDFRQSFLEMTWAQRKKKLLHDGKQLKVFLAETENGTAIGYCIASIDSALAGEIESIYIEPAGRGLGVGRNFIERSLAWFDGKKIKDISISVAVGNEEALPFYEKFGFKPRTYYLSRVGR